MPHEQPWLDKEPKPLVPTELRSYQKDIVEEVEYKLAFETERVVVAASMGAGKSVIISELCRRFAGNGMSVAVLTNISALIPQLRKHLDLMGVGTRVIKAGHDEGDKNATVTLIMEQSFHDKKREELDVRADVVIKDEWHIGAYGKRYDSILRHLRPLNEIGLTATPIDERGYLLVPDNEIVWRGTTKELINGGYLVKPRYFIPKWAQKMDYSGVRMSGADYSEVALRELIDTPEFTEQAIDAWILLNGPKRQTAFYCCGIDHAESFAEALEARGYSPKVVHSKRNQTANDEAVEAFKKGEAKILVSVSSLLIGFDAPNMDLLVNMRPTRILRLWNQLGGRVLRTHPGKEHGDILDLGQCVSTLGFIEEPLPKIESGDKAELRKAMERREKPIVDRMVKEEPTEITFEKVLAEIERIEKDKNDIRKIELNKLMTVFDLETDPKKIIEMGFEIHSRVTGTRYKEKDILFAYEPWAELFDDYGQYDRMLRKMLKKRIRSIVKKAAKEGFGKPGTKLAALHWFPEWLTTKSDIRWMFGARQEEYEYVDEDDVPF